MDEAQEDEPTEPKAEEELGVQKETFNVCKHTICVQAYENTDLWLSKQEVRFINKTPDKTKWEGIFKKEERKFAFDHAFDETVGTQEIYKNTSRNVVRRIVEGYNATVFAYGATGAGKTHTMVGDKNEPGIMVCTLKDLFHLANKNKIHYEINILIAFMEIYNEEIRDLMSKERAVVKLRESPTKVFPLPPLGFSPSPFSNFTHLSGAFSFFSSKKKKKKKGVVVSGVKLVPAGTSEEVIRLLEVGNRRRTTEATLMNETSSRSHAILQIYVETKPKTDEQSHKIMNGKLNMIDLAGSERGTVASNQGNQREGSNINRSLLALGNCINALVDGKKFVPYRDSKLTRMLQDALGGNSLAVMIVNLSPSSIQWEETHNSLKYADRAKNIRVDPKLNIRKNDDTSHLPQVVQSLRAELDQLKKQLANAQQHLSPDVNPSLQARSSVLSVLSNDKDKDNDNDKDKDNDNDNDNESKRLMVGLSDTDWAIIKEVQAWLADKFDHLKEYLHLKAEATQQLTHLMTSATTLKVNF
ncbi:kinesin heavy chain [Reticulomyxa filosa]|uniref:Kinesin-like protein n=1 Tax=Reticulomyxa filosa TaxID=46433 RepID=X6P6H0_RETFI|nr:kinesin heavy chain [Reticulomyxa filosa]|eukprot:ETO33684.1 kinesin heavy chain [Reticulomyxa filosa]